MATHGKRRSSHLGVLAGVALALALAGCSSSPSAGSSSTAASSSSGALVGLFKIDPGVCSSAGVTSGSWFRMVQGGGNVSAGPFLPNGDSTCGDKTWTSLAPGTDGGLRTGAYQASPSPAFDSGGNGLASAIVAPVTFFSVKFAVATDPTDPQTSKAVPKPSITVSGTTLSGNLEAFGVAWNKQYFNQGSPKPDGTKPGNTSGPTGTYDSSTHTYTLQWSSQIAGGPFNNFTGVWHLEGTFVPGT